MTEDAEKQSVGGPSEESSGVATKAPAVSPGRKPSSYYAKGAQEILSVTAPYAAEILEFHVRRRKGWSSLAPGLLETCKFIIDHAIGRAKIKVEHSGAVLTYGEVAKNAETLAKKGRDVLADAEAIKDGYAGSDGGSSPAATQADADK